MSALPVRFPRPLAAAAIAALLAAACAGEPADDGVDEAALAALDSIEAVEDTTFVVDPARFAEMRGGRLDTVNMIGEGPDIAWHVQAMNYHADFIAMTYATWYVGPDSVVRLAADEQPRLVDEDGVEYPGALIPDNPRIAVETGTTAVGVILFEKPLSPDADSLTLYVNDSTPPVLRVGPFGVEHDAGSGLRMESRPGG